MESGADGDGGAWRLLEAAAAAFPDVPSAGDALPKLHLDKRRQCSFWSLLEPGPAACADDADVPGTLPGRPGEEAWTAAPGTWQASLPESAKRARNKGRNGRSTGKGVLTAALPGAAFRFQGVQGNRALNPPSDLLSGGSRHPGQQQAPLGTVSSPSPAARMGGGGCIASISRGGRARAAASARKGPARESPPPRTTAWGWNRWMACERPKASAPAVLSRRASARGSDSARAGARARASHPPWRAACRARGLPDAGRPAS